MNNVVGWYILCYIINGVSIHEGDAITTNSQYYSLPVIDLL